MPDPVSDRAGRRLLSLDLWHTLLYLDPAAEEAYMREQGDLAVRILTAAPSRGGGADSEAKLRGAFDTVYASAVSASQQGRTVTPAEQIAEAARRLGRSVDPAAYVRGLADLVARTPFARAPDAVETLHRLREEGWETAVVSNTVGEPGTAIRPVLTAMGYDPLVDAFVFSDEHPWTKPAPEIFREATVRVGVPPERTVHVGDGWVDIEGARRAGLRAGVLYTGLQQYGQRYRELFLPEGWSNPETPYRVASWKELPALLGALL